MKKLFIPLLLFPLILNAQDYYRKGQSSITLDNGSIRREISPKKAYITHISHQMGLHSEVSKELPSGISLAFDGLSFKCDD